LASRPGLLGSEECKAGRFAYGVERNKQRPILGLCSARFFQVSNPILAG
jgi:hypothetical protein